MEIFKKSLTFYLRAYKIRQRLAANFDGWINFELADSLQAISIVYNRLGNLRMALKHSLNVLEMRKSLYEPNFDSIDVALSYKNVARIYFGLNDGVNGMKYFKSGLEMKRRLEENMLIF